jgi:hypothetical protein
LLHLIGEVLELLGECLRVAGVQVPKCGGHSTERLSQRGPVVGDLGGRVDRPQGICRLFDGFDRSVGIGRVRQAVEIFQPVPDSLDLSTETIVVGSLGWRLLGRFDAGALV